MQNKLGLKKNNSGGINLNLTKKESRNNNLLLSSSCLCTFQFFLFVLFQNSDESAKNAATVMSYTDYIIIPKQLWI